MDSLQHRISASLNKRDELLQYLNGKQALEEYALLAKRLAEYEEKKNRLIDFLNYKNNLDEKEQVIQEEMIRMDRLASEYIASKPISEIDKQFKSIANSLYKNMPAGIVLENNKKDNKLRFNIDVSIEGDAADGISSARILCSDWLLSVYGVNHTIDFLWHDNRLFADINRSSRATWFKYVLNQTKYSKKQYIASLNDENFNTMKEYLDEPTFKNLESSIRLRLSGDKDEHKLMGISFSSKG